ncbi:MAG: methyltransferase [bacterium]
MAFRFKKFTIEDDQSTLRVGTDAMVLGSWSDPGDAGTILDIGTGCGVLALMMAQKSGSGIDAIDVDQPSVNQAGENFTRSPWSGRLRAIASSLEAYALNSDKSFDFIISNPPFFENQLKSSREKVNVAKHDTGLSLKTLVRSAEKLLSPGGRICLIYPFANQRYFDETILGCGFHISRRMVLIPRQGLPPGRLLTECMRSPAIQENPSEICILGKNGKFSSEYIKLTGDFHDF